MMKREHPPKTTLEKAQDTLKHIAKLAPDSSGNMVLYLNETHAAKVSNSLTKSKHYSLWCQRSYQAMLSSYSESALKKHDQETIVICRVLLSLAHKLELEIDSNKIVGFARCISSYRFIKQHKAGICDHLSFATAYDLFINRHQDVAVYVGEKKFMHTFAITNIHNKKLQHKKSITISQLDDNFLIVDPWIRCVFKKEVIEHFWGQLAPGICLTKDDLKQSDTRKDKLYLNKLKCKLNVYLTHQDHHLSKLADEIARYSPTHWDFFIEKHQTHGANELIRYCLEENTPLLRM